jgi:hypothetical protein
MLAWGTFTSFAPLTARLGGYSHRELAGIPGRLSVGGRRSVVYTFAVHDGFGQACSTSRQKRWWPGILCRGPRNIESARRAERQPRLHITATSRALTMTGSAHQPYEAKDDEPDEPGDTKAGSDTASKDSAEEPDQREQVEDSQRPRCLPPLWWEPPVSRHRVRPYLRIRWCHRYLRVFTRVIFLWASLKEQYVMTSAYPIPA